MKSSEKKIAIENVNVPGQITSVNAEKYADMKHALLTILPESSPGLTHKDVMQAVLEHLSDELFPQGQKRGWWSKAVQLDLEAKGIIVREDAKPLRWYKKRVA